MARGGGATTRQSTSEARSRRRSLVVLVILLVVAFPLLLWWGHRTWFTIDDWDFLAARQAGSVGDLLRPHNGHWSMLPMLAYRTVWAMFGIRTYLPYLVLIVVAHLTVAALLFVVMRRANVELWLAALMTASLVFFGAGVDDIFVAYNVGFVAAIAFGLGQLLLADHPGEVDRRDWLGLACGICAVMCSGTSIPIVVVVGLITIRRGWRCVLFHTAPFAVLYLSWLAVAPKAQSAITYKRGSLGNVASFVVVGAEAAFGGLGQVPGIEIVLALILIAGLSLSLSGRERNSTPLALLAGAAIFLILTGFTRAGTQRVLVGDHWVLVPGSPAERARISRYVYIVAALALPALAVAAQSLIRRWRLLAPAVIAVLLLGVAGNVRDLVNYRRGPAYVTQVRTALLHVAAHNNGLPRSSRPQPFYAREVTIGWLRDARRDGKLPTLRRERAIAAIPRPAVDDSHKRRHLRPR